MTKGTGFLQLRRGLWAHVRDGRMCLADAAVLLYICCEADTRTGVWKGAPKALAGELSLSESTARAVLERLEDRGYIRRFPVPGSHHCYPILVHKFLITQGAHAGEQVNALDSSTPNDLRYFPRELNVEEVVGDDGELSVKQDAPQRRMEKKEKKTEKNDAAKTAPPTDNRHKQFLGTAFEAFRAQFGQSPTWSNKEFKGLSLFLAKHGQIELAEWQRRFQNFMASTDEFVCNQGGSLLYFLANFDKFIHGPILSKGGGPGTNGNSNKYESFDERRRRENAEAIRSTIADIGSLV